MATTRKIDRVSVIVAIKGMGMNLKKKYALTQRANTANIVVKILLNGSFTRYCLKMIIRNSDINKQSKNLNKCGIPIPKIHMVRSS